MSKKISFPKFLEGEPLPKGYYDSVNPFKDPPVWNVNLHGLAEYAESKGVHIAELSKEEYNMFRT